ncbi:response regulator transcription factor [Miltoncostaea marina]|uniref:response regulator transcription factor n=1 Tax=Miltoncostaea marina TaxID=2843215 RepID=UPI001C3E6927|nr:response regulator transcription factor [Miltoncostaea marina]
MVGGTAEGPEARILVVDDEDPIRQLLCTVLRYEGFATTEAASGRDALASAADVRPDLVLLDVMLPDMDGFEVHRRLTGAGPGRLPVVFLTARRATDDRVRGLTIGADDYVVKPFSLEELVARVRAVLRRTRGEEAGRRRLTVEDLELDDETREVRRAGRLVELTPTEYGLLRYLMANAGRVLSKAQILDHVWSYDFGGDSNVVETYISYLRKKIDRGAEPLIQTVRGFGYTLRPRRG